MDRMDTMNRIKNPMRMHTHASRMCMCVRPKKHPIHPIHHIKVLCCNGLWWI